MTRHCTAAAQTALVLLTAGAALGQPAPYFWNGGTDNFSVTANWVEADDSVAPGPPESRFNEVAIFERGGQATVTGVVPSTLDGEEVRPGALELINGTLTITNTGVLRVVPDPVNNPSNFTIGNTEIINSGVLELVSGAVFETETLAFDDPDIVVDSPGTLALTLTGPGFSPIRVEQQAQLGGTLSLGFDGYTPATNDTWTIINAGGIDGGFDAITTPGVELPPAQFYDLRTAAAPGGRSEAELFLNQTQIVLQVDRRSGEMTLSKAVGSSVAIDGYQIVSDSGSLTSDDDRWTRLGETFPGSDWRVSNPSSNQIAELEPGGSTEVGATPVSLGRVFSPEAPTEFRQPSATVEDLLFQYTTADGAIETGVVSYVNQPVNDLLIQIDPVTGNVRLSNPSPFDVAIDGYRLLSEAGSLTPAGWSSLDERGDVGAWRESNPSSAAVAELLQTGELSFTSGAFFDLGQLFDEVDGERDVVFEFLFPGESQPLLGAVVYAPIVVSDQDGDFNGDGVVNSADFTVWRDNLNRPESTGVLSGNGDGGLVTVSDYQLWKLNFGAGLGDVSAKATGTPEPHSLFAVLSVLGLFGRRGR